MFKCPAIILFMEFSFITFSPILASLNFSGAEKKGNFRMAPAWV